MRTIDRYAHLTQFGLYKQLVMEEFVKMDKAKFERCYHCGFNFCGDKDCPHSYQEKVEEAMKRQLDWVKKVFLEGEE